MFMLNRLMKFILISLFIFTPMAFGSMEFWAFSLMELGILLIIIFWSVQETQGSFGNNSLSHNSQSAVRNHSFTTPSSSIFHPPPSILLLLSLFLGFVFFQMLPISGEIVKVISPETYHIRHSLALNNSALLTLDSKFPISFFSFATRVELFKWITLIGFFLFLLRWRIPAERLTHLIPVIILVGTAESLYGMFEFFTGHRHILHLGGPLLVTAVTGTFINRNYFAGYLLMVIPLSIGYVFMRGALRSDGDRGIRYGISSVDGKTLLVIFGIIVMILGLLFSASRMGILSLLLSFSLAIPFFRNPEKEKRFSKTSVLILGLALLWAGTIGLDSVISRFFAGAEGLKSRWMIWGNTFEIVKAFPLFGSGLGTFSEIFPMYRSFPMLNFITHAENDFLQLASETGLIGFGILGALFLLLFVKAVSGIGSLSYGEPRRYVGIGGLVGILALMFHSTVERNLQVPSNAFLFTFILALVLRVCIRENQQEKVKAKVERTQRRIDSITQRRPETQKRNPPTHWHAPKDK
jgi:putative inorganic carbon (HCO3(-)) transporter